MMNLIFFLKRFLRKPSPYLTLFLGVALGQGIPFLTNFRNPDFYTQNYENIWINAGIAFGCLIMVATIWNYFAKYRLLKRQFTSVANVIMSSTQLKDANDLYLARESHFAWEKRHLAHSLVRKAIPQLLKVMREETPGLVRINFLIDSGTTLTPIFEELLKAKLAYQNNLRVRVYTNNLEGAHKTQSSEHLLDSELSERDFCIIGGEILGKYRATVGKSFQKFFFESYSKIITADTVPEAKQKTIAILSANWYLLSASQFVPVGRNAEHVHIKEQMIKIADRIIFVSPLGKVLKTDNLGLLQKYANASELETGSEYLPVKIEGGKKPYFFTTIRKEGSQSVLKKHSDAVKLQLENHPQLNFMKKFLHEFEPPRRDKIFEIPHDYANVYAKELYHL